MLKRADKAQLSLGCTHLNTRSLRSLVLKNGYNPNSTVLYLGHLSMVRNNLFLNEQLHCNNILVSDFIVYFTFPIVKMAANYAKSED